MLKTVVEKAGALLNLSGTVEERRKAPRVNCQFTVICGYSRQTVEGTIADISLNGLRLRVPSRISKGERITVSRPDCEHSPVTCRAVWSKPFVAEVGYFVGARFTDTKESRGRSWLPHTLRELGLETADSKERRNFIRFPAPPVAALMVGDEGLSTQGKLLNIGYGGALIAASEEMGTDSVVRLQLPPSTDVPGLSVFALVRSSIPGDGGIYTTGIEFSKPGVGEVKAYIRAVKKSLRP